MDPLRAQESAPGPPPSLDGLLQSGWHELEKALTDGNHGWHLAAIASVGADGGPDCRTVVLRAVDPEARTVAFHTDRRAAKIATLQRDPRVSVLVYDRALRIQLRAAGEASVHLDDDLADAAWQRSSPSSRRCYLAPHAPSSTLEDFSPNLPGDLLHRAPDEAGSELGRDNFALVTVRLDVIDWLHLRHDGHVRARFSWDRDGALFSEWVAP